ncbi:MAG: NDP-sugar synthase [Thermoanaerobaculia bacterium]|nr:NDP-sugar synthase [Thermoanaerobaculia bacterium]
MKAMVLAAGFGTRFHPVTHTIPKPMIPVLNRPLLGWVVESCIDAGFDDLIVNLHHLPGAIRQYLDEEFGDRASIELSLEEEILGTGGALRRVRDRLGDDFVLVNGDTIQWPPLQDLVDRRREKGALACLLLRHAPADDSFTPVWLDRGWITGFVEGTGEPLMFSGAHAISREVLDLLPERDFSALTSEVYIPVVNDDVERLAGLVDDGDWFDVGTPLRYMEASRTLLSKTCAGELGAPRGNEIVENGSLAHHSAIARGEIERCSIGSGSTIEAGSVMSDTVAWSRVGIGSGSEVRDSIVADGVSLPAGTVVRNALVVNGSDEIPDQEEIERTGDWLVRAIDPSEPMTFRTG